MKIVNEVITVTSVGYRPTFHLLTDEIEGIIRGHNIKEGLCTIYTSHTTCSVITQEKSFDKTYTDLEYLQQDFIEIFDAIIPVCKREGQYLHPGPLLTEFSAQHGEEKPQTLNTDAHLRSALIGRSESMGIVEGKLDRGMFGHIYFIDFDQTCTRERKIKIQIIGQ
ncbi:MAG: YjbQ family protein [Defluviitaleaceae bacterium]|nr:YjbQ family protein [Defluviitaleaceae bacterium]